MNVELVAVAVMSVDLLQLGLVQGLVPGLVQVVAHLVHVVLGQGGAIQRVLGYGDHHSSSGVRSWTSEQLQTSSATLLNQVLVTISNFKYYFHLPHCSQTHKIRGYNVICFRPMGLEPSSHFLD